MQARHWAHFYLLCVLIGRYFHLGVRSESQMGYFKSIIIFSYFMFCIQIELEKKKPRARGERVARNMAFIFSVLLSRLLFFCIMAPICCAPVVLGNDSFLIASTETRVLELPITKLKKCTFRRVSNPFSILRPELFGCLWLLEDKHITLTDF